MLVCHVLLTVLVSDLLIYFPHSLTISLHSPLVSPHLFISYCLPLVDQRGPEGCTAAYDAGGDRDAQGEAAREAAWH